MAFLHGFFLAFGLILPLGVQNIFIFNQGAAQPSLFRALPAVVTAILCDTLLILLAVLGVSVMVLSVSWVKMVFILVGILFLIYMGILTWRSSISSPNSQPQPQPESAPEQMVSENINNIGIKAISAKKQIVFAASVSLLNPHAILDTVGVIGTSSLQYVGMDKLWFTGASILVSFIWFLFLAGAGRVIGQFNPSFIPLLNRISAIIMWGSAVYLSFSFLSV
jgi:L-lysine exporter family protein LysE/ArgO